MEIRKIKLCSTLDVFSTNSSMLWLNHAEEKDAQLRGGRIVGLPCLFLKIEKSALIWEKKVPDSVHIQKVSILNFAFKI